MEIIWSIKDCQLQRNEDILNLDMQCKNDYYQSKFSKKANNFCDTLKFCNTFAIILKCCNNFYNSWKNLQYFL